MINHSATYPSSSPACSKYSIKFFAFLKQLKSLPSSIS